MKVKFNRRELAAILKNEATRRELERRANLIHSAINHEGYEVSSGIGKNRARAAVIAVTQYARRSNALHNTLVRHIGAGRG
jgi:predicted secreted protein